MNNAKSLGRGLGSLLGVNNTNPQLNKTRDNLENDQFVQIAIDKIKRNPFQPRENFDLVKIEELANSIKEHGVLEPLIITKDGIDNYELVSGERRLRASKIAGLTTVPAIIKDIGRREKLEIAIIENVQREDLNPIERAKSYQRLSDEFNYTQDDIAKRVSKSRESVANSLRLLKLPEKIKIYLQKGQLTEGHAKILLGIFEPEKQLLYAEMILKDNLTVRQLSQSVTQNPKKKNTNNSQKNPNLIALEQDLRQVLGTKVEIIGTEEKGKINIEYYSANDLRNIISLVKR